MPLDDYFFAKWNKKETKNKQDFDRGVYYIYSLFAPMTTELRASQPPPPDVANAPDNRSREHRMTSHSFWAFHEKKKTAQRLIILDCAEHWVKYIRQLRTEKQRAEWAKTEESIGIYQRNDRQPGTSNSTVILY